MLSQAVLLAHPDPDGQLVLYTDSSNFAIGAAINQISNSEVGSKIQPLAFFPAKLTAAQQKWSAFDRELYAIYASIKHFRHMLEGRDVVIYTDHKPLTFAFDQKPDKSSPRQLRHLDYIGQFCTNILYVKGPENIPADILSRINAISVPDTIDYEEIATTNSDLNYR